MSNYNSTLQSNNTDLQSILSTINGLPNATAQATPSITVDASGLITATAGSKSATKQLDTQSLQTIIPGTADISIVSGKYLTGTQTIKGDTNLVSENIKSGVSIFGVNGTCSSGSSSSGFSNGTSWTQSNLTDDAIGDVCFANGLWRAVGKNAIYQSVDGKTWTVNFLFSSSLSSVASVRVVYGNGVWIVNADKLYYSTDGLTWTVANNTSMSCLEYANGLWVGFKNYCYYSVDGITWTKGTTLCHIISIYYSDGLWVGCSKSATSSYKGIYYSTDGKNWTRCNSNACHCVKKENGIWVVGGTGGIYYSTDGKNWTQSNASGNVYSIACYNGLWLAGGNSGFYYSADGKTWTINTTMTASSSAYMKDAYYANGIWLMNYVNRRAYYSFDGLAWNICKDGSNSINKIYNANGIWVVVSSDGIYYSITWELLA